jgi:hypothetical protein
MNHLLDYEDRSFGRGCRSLRLAQIPIVELSSFGVGYVLELYRGVRGLR